MKQHLENRSDIWPQIAFELGKHDLNPIIKMIILLWAVSYAHQHHSSLDIAVLTYLYKISHDQPLIPSLTIPPDLVSRVSTLPPAIATRDLGLAHQQRGKVFMDRLIEEELRTWYQEHAQNFQPLPFVSFDQIFNVLERVTTKKISLTERMILLLNHFATYVFGNASVRLSLLSYLYNVYDKHPAPLALPYRLIRDQELWNDPSLDENQKQKIQQRKWMQLSARKKRKLLYPQIINNLRNQGLFEEES